MAETPIHGLTGSPTDYKYQGGGDIEGKEPGSEVFPQPLPNYELHQAPTQSEAEVPPTAHLPMEQLPHYQNITNPPGYLFKVDVLHKPRGSNGKWYSVLPQQRIRVANKFGKMLRVTVATNSDMDWSTLRITMLEKTDSAWVPSSAKNGFEILSQKLFKKNGPQDELAGDIENDATTLQLDLKLFTSYKSISFFVTASTVSGITLKGQTVEIFTHNSGGPEHAKKRAECKRRRFMQELEGEEFDCSFATPHFTSHHPGLPTPSISPNSRSPVTISEEHSTSSQPMASFGVMPNVVHPGSNIGSAAPLSYSNIPEQAPTGVTRQPAPSAPAPTFNTVEQQQPQQTLYHWHVLPGNLQVDGAVRARSFLQYSDVRLKTNMEDICDALDLVMKLKGKSYTWKKGCLDVEHEADSGRRVLGLIAQEVQRVVPEVVTEMPDGLLAVNYSEIVPILIEAFKQHVGEYRELKEKFETLHVENKHLGEVVHELKRMYQQITKKERESPHKGHHLSMTPTIDSVNVHMGDIDKSKLRSSSSSASESTSSTSSDPVPSHSKIKQMSSESVKVALDKSNMPVTYDIEGAKRLTNSKTSRSIGWKLFTVAILIISLLGATAGCLIAFFGASADNPLVTDPLPPINYMLTSNQLTNGGFEVEDPSNPQRALGWLGGYELLSINSKRRDGYPPFNMSSILPLPFEGGNNILRLNNLSNTSIANATTIIERDWTKYGGFDFWGADIALWLDTTHVRWCPVDEAPYCRLQAKFLGSDAVIHDFVFPKSKKWHEQHFSITFKNPNLESIFIQLLSACEGDVFIDNVQLAFVIDSKESLLEEDDDDDKN